MSNSAKYVSENKKKPKDPKALTASMYNTGEGFFKSLTTFHGNEIGEKSEKKKKVLSKQIRDTPMNLVSQTMGNKSLIENEELRKRARVERLMLTRLT